MRTLWYCCYHPTIIGDGDPSEGQREQSSISDLWSLMQVYFRFMAVFLSSGATSNEKFMGLAADVHLIIQDLEDTQWLNYGQEYCQWAQGLKKC